MKIRMTREEFLEFIFRKKYEELEGKDLRLVSLNAKGKEISLAQMIGVPQRRVYETLGLHIGTRAGEDHIGECIGLLHIAPEEATIVAADIALKSSNVEIGFLDRFRGSLILLGAHMEVRQALESIISFFDQELKFTVCNITER